MPANTTKSKIYPAILALVVFLYIVCGSFFHLPTLAQPKSSERQIMILIDNSGSIGDTLTKDPSGKPILSRPIADKWLRDVEARVTRLIKTEIPDNIPIGLIEFGYNCDYKLLVPLGTGNRPDLLTKLSKIKPSKDLSYTTPIIKSMNGAATLLREVVDPEIILFTDGGENCDGSEVDQCTNLKRVVKKLTGINFPFNRLTVVSIGYRAYLSSGVYRSVPFEDCKEELENDPDYEPYIKIVPLRANTPDELAVLQIPIDTPSSNGIFDRVWSSIKEFAVVLAFVGAFGAGLAAFLYKKNHP